MKKKSGNLSYAPQLRKKDIHVVKKEHVMKLLFKEDIYAVKNRHIVL